MRSRGGTQSSPISTTDVVEAAMRVVERSSLGRMTVRDVAQECGVTAPAIHYHLRGAGNLADRVVEAVTAQIDITVDPEATWFDQYVRLVMDMDAAFLRYPGTGLHALTAVGPSVAAGRLTETALRILRSGGFSEEEAVELFTATYLLFVGWLATRGLAEEDIVHPALATARRVGPHTSGSSSLQSALGRILGTAVPSTSPEDQRKQRMEIER
ncbi:TetR family transcriptional regulator (plasmid) [Rhodococcus erythropolis]|uniref:TetR family transcriptional regulator n=1 Tax=Rhodococcus TaxID=1827 RepID=UPI0012452C9A|nr:MULTISPECIES: TetR family transcriptional regulator [Rhodococcus]MCJ0950626.1 TetR family transcriptional regulator [Rhodococcus sp. ARC_M8]MDJ0441707.1 TetR family transcriptional regulator [Rhodococcus qingshengii]QEX08384.1 TetR family transcriptional regulator [Rhodococcus erythropolis]